MANYNMPPFSLRAIVYLTWVRLGLKCLRLIALSHAVLRCCFFGSSCILYRFIKSTNAPRNIVIVFNGRVIFPHRTVYNRKWTIPALTKDNSCMTWLSKIGNWKIYNYSGIRTQQAVYKPICSLYRLVCSFKLFYY